MYNNIEFESNSDFYKTEWIQAYIIVAIGTMKLVAAATVKSLGVWIIKSWSSLSDKTVRKNIIILHVLKRRRNSRNALVTNQALRFMKNYTETEINMLFLFHKMFSEFCQKKDAAAGFFHNTF